MPKSGKSKMKNLNFDLGLDFGIEQINELDINAVCYESEQKERVCFNLENGTRQLEYLLRDFDLNKDYHFISNGKGFSSINFIDFVVKKFSKIDELYASSLAVGKKHILHLSDLPIDKAHFVVCTIFSESNVANTYDYYDVFREVCKEKQWDIVSAKNHSKIILMQSGELRFVLETSSNLNENPKIEQFHFCENKGLFDFYKQWFLAMQNGKRKAE